MFIDLRDRVAVLVGRNGAGKSAILEGFQSIALWVLGRVNNSRKFDLANTPQVLNIEILVPGNRRLEYRYALIHQSTTTQNLESAKNYLSPEDAEVIPFSWNDCCQYLDGDQEIVWKTEAGEITFNDGTIAILGHVSSLQINQLWKSSSRQIPEEIQWIQMVLNRVTLLGKTSIRQEPIRNTVFIRVVDDYPAVHLGVPSGIDFLGLKILQMKSEEVHALEKICQRIELGNEIIIHKFLPAQNSKSNTESSHVEYIASVELDDINIGLLSDGTLRILVLLVELISAPSSTTTMIEEPETQIHPGLLEKLLNEIEAYTADENLILSTHSPQVVSWTQPNKINLVYRQNGRTYVRKLKETEIESVVDYLNEEGSLGEWLYSGGLDD